MRATLLFLTHFLIIAVSAQSKWSAIMSQGDMGQTYNSYYTLGAVENFILDQAKESKVVSEMVYGNGKWYVVATYRKEKTTISWQWDKEFPSSWIKKEWDNGKYITKVAWGDNNWAVIMTTGTTFREQKWATRNSWADMEKWFAETWKENTSYIITDLAYGNGKWCAVLSIPANHEPQSYKVSEEFPSKWIQSKYDDKFNISAAEHDGKNWYVVMTKKSSQLSETILNPQAAFPDSKIKEEWDKNRVISALVYIRSEDKSKVEDFAFDLDPDLFNDSKFEDLKRSAQSKSEAKDYKGAIADYEKALKYKTTDEVVWNNLAWAKYLGGYCFSALEDVNKSLAIKSTAYNNHTKATILQCQGKCSESLPFFNEAIRLYRLQYGKVDNIAYYADRADAKKCMGNTSGAIDDLELALSIEPGNETLKRKLKNWNGQ